MIITDMTTSSKGDVFNITGLLWGESTGQWWIPAIKASNAELWSSPEQTAEQTIETLVIWDALIPIMMSL